MDHRNAEDLTAALRVSIEFGLDKTLSLPIEQIDHRKMTKAAPSTPETATLPVGLDEMLLIREFEKFVTAELELLDGREFEAWRDLFTEDGYYWVPSRIDQESPDDELSLFYDDREIMDLRFQRLRHPRVHAQIPYTRTTHVAGNFVVNAADETSDEYAFAYRFVMHEYRPEMKQRAFSGRCEYTVVRDGSSFKIRTKKVTVINCDDFHFPISIPF